MAMRTLLPLEGVRVFVIRVKENEMACGCELDLLEKDIWSEDLRIIVWCVRGAVNLEIKLAPFSWIG